jgi:hypothetical protein
MRVGTFRAYEVWRSEVAKMVMEGKIDGYG